MRFEAEKLVKEGVRPTWFELGTAIAFLWFCEQRVDAAVIEVGLGGRLDPTNVIHPELCLIGPIGLEHTRQLGDTLEKIAFEKAGIIKPGVPVAVQRQQTESVRRVFIDAAQERGAPLTDLCDYPLEDVRSDRFGSDFSIDGLRARVNLPGRHQAGNAALALMGLRLLQAQGWALDTGAALEGLKRTIWPARLEWIDDQTLIDGAHNGHGARALADYVRDYEGQAHRAGGRHDEGQGRSRMRRRVRDLCERGCRDADQLSPRHALRGVGGNPEEPRRCGGSRGGRGKGRRAGPGAGGRGRRCADLRLALSGGRRAHPIEGRRRTAVNALYNEEEILMKKSNLHTHTVLCDGRDTVRHMADRAYGKGFVSLGFSGHGKQTCNRFAHPRRARIRRRGARGRTSL